jgi:hypothetical protein
MAVVTSQFAIRLGLANCSVFRNINTVIRDKLLYSSFGWWHCFVTDCFGDVSETCGGCTSKIHCLESATKSFYRDAGKEETIFHSIRHITLQDKIRI